MKQALKYFWPSALVLAAILWLTLAPRPIGEVHIELFAGADKLVHAIMMASLTAAIIFDKWRMDRRMSFTFIGASSASVVVFSAFDEYMQSRMSMGRTGDWADFVADCAGILIAAAMACMLLPKANGAKATPRKKSKA